MAKLFSFQSPGGMRPSAEPSRTEAGRRRRLKQQVRRLEGVRPTAARAVLTILHVIIKTASLALVWT